MGLIEKRPNIKLNVNVLLYICTREQLNTEMLYCLYFYNSGKEMASALNVAVILKQKLHHFINCNTGNGVQHVNNHYEQPKCCCHSSFQGYYGVLCRCDNRPIKSLTKDSGGLGGRFTVQNFRKIYTCLIIG